METKKKKTWINQKETKILSFAKDLERNYDLFIVLVFKKKKPKKPKLMHFRLFISMLWRLLLWERHMVQYKVFRSHEIH